MAKLFLFFHIMGAIIFLGNIIVTFFWKVMANRTKNPSVLAFSQKLVTKTDRFFTALGAGLLAATGYAYASYLKMDVASSWLLWAQVTFYASAIIWAVVLLPIQHKQSKLADEFLETLVVPDEYWTLANRWNLVGTVATILPIISLYFMVVKPF